MGNSHREQLTVDRERAVLVGVGLPERPLEEYPGALAELRGLAASAGANVLDQVTQNRERPDLGTFIGKGKVEELAERCAAHEAAVAIFDHELQPAQLKELEKRIKVKVVDRTELILDIFATRAQTTQARLQVELAQLEYLRPRLKRMWTHLERHDGGIGTRGPGEKQLETDRRLIDRKIRDLKARLVTIEDRKEREVASRAEAPRVSLVGYTNAGKSTLMRRLTGADVLVADKLFATLDTRTRKWTVPKWGKALLSDTVGFIRSLPHDLVASFKATLAEAVHADLLLHVVDAANPAALQHVEAVNAVLEEIGVRSKPTILVLNQCDRAEDPAVLVALERLHPLTARVSAVAGTGLAKLAELVGEQLGKSHARAEVVIHAGDGKTLAHLATYAQEHARRFEGDWAVLDVSLPRAALERLRREGVEVREPGVAPVSPAAE